MRRGASQQRDLAGHLDQLPPVALAAVPATKNQRSGENARDIFTKSFTTILSAERLVIPGDSRRLASSSRRGEECLCDDQLELLAQRSSFCSQTEVVGAQCNDLGLLLPREWQQLRSRSASAVGILVGDKHLQQGKVPILYPFILVWSAMPPQCATPPSLLST